MKKITSLLTLFLLVACQPSELERCIEANVKDLDEGEKILLELEEELNSIAPDLNLFGDFSSSLNLIYGLQPLAWEDGVELRKEGVLKLSRAFAKKRNFCSVFDFDSLAKHQECNESKNLNLSLSEAEAEELQLSYQRESLKQSVKDIQQAMIFRHFQLNHYETMDDWYAEDSEQLLVKKEPRKWTIADMAIIISETLEEIETYNGFALSFEETGNEFGAKSMRLNIEYTEREIEEQLLLIKNSIESAKPKIAEDACNSQGIY